MLAMPIEMTAIIEAVKIKCLHLELIQAVYHANMNCDLPLECSVSHGIAIQEAERKWRCTYCVCEQVSHESTQLFT